MYWSANQGKILNPGNELYRYQPATDTLEDLTPEAGSENGAEVQGVVGISEDGKRVYVVANGDLDGAGEATPGDCKTSPPHGSLTRTSGSCNVYLWQGGESTLVARLGTGGGKSFSDALNWTPTTSGIFGSYVAKTALLSADGQTLVFRSSQKLSAYDNEGTPELYRYSADDQALSCVSCAPSGGAALRSPRFDSVDYPGALSPPVGGVSVTESRNLSVDGERVFFETAEALSPEDTNGQGGCLPSGSQPQQYPSCQDVYEWEAQGSGSCKEDTQGGGCLYLLTTGKSPEASFFGDASLDGKEAFLFTRDRLVGQDQDELFDVYDARVGGGLASQNEPPKIDCESTDGCLGAVGTPPAVQSPGTLLFEGSGNVKESPKCPKGKVRRGGKCVKKSGKGGRHKKHRRANRHGRTR